MYLSLCLQLNVVSPKTRQPSSILRLVVAAAFLAASPPNMLMRSGHIRPGQPATCTHAHMGQRSGQGERGGAVSCFNKGEGQGRGCYSTCARACSVPHGFVPEVGTLRQTAMHHGQLPSEKMPLHRIGSEPTPQWRARPFQRIGSVSPTSTLLPRSRCRAIYLAVTNPGR